MQAWGYGKFGSGLSLGPNRDTDNELGDNSNDSDGVLRLSQVKVP